jgi:hypothetical protein
MKMNILKEFIESFLRFIESIIDTYAELAKSNSFAKYVMKIFDEQIKNNYYFNTYSNIIDEQIGETRNRL